MPRRHPLTGLLVLAGLLLSVRPAHAVSCTVSTTSMAFGSYNVFSTAPIDSTASLVIRCDGGVKTMSISISRGSAATFARQMLKGAEALLYNLYRDAARTLIWGDGSSGTQTDIESSIPKNTDIPLTVYGRISAGQDVSAGSYTDSVTVTINY